MAKGWPKHVRVTLWDDAADSIPIELPKRRMWPMGLLFAVFFAIFATVDCVMIAKASLHSVFAFVYFLFVGPDGILPDSGVWNELRAIFLPLWPALAALVVSHGISFFLNFIGHRE